MQRHDVSDGTVYLDCQQLQPADVILTAQRSLVSSAIRAATRGPYSHAALVIDKDLIFEATQEGVGYTRLSCARLEYPTASHDVRQLHALPEAVTRAVVLRRGGLVGVTKSRLTQLVTPFLWKQYPALAETTTVFDTPTMRRGFAALLRLHDRTRKTPLRNPGLFCSQLVAAIFQALDSPLIPGIAAERFSPSRILKAALTDVEHAVTQPDPTATIDELRRELINKLQVGLPFSREVLPELVEFQALVEELKRRAKPQ